MSLISPSDQQRLRGMFAVMTRRVRLLFFTQTLGCDTCAQARRIVDELPELSDKIAVDEVNFILEPEKAAQYGIDRVPAVAIVYEDKPDAPPTDAHIRFLGAPSGYEFLSLVQAVLLAGGGPSSLSEASRRQIAAVTTPVTMRVFTTPT